MWTNNKAFKSRMRPDPDCGELETIEHLLCEFTHHSSSQRRGDNVPCASDDNAILAQDRKYGPWETALLGEPPKQDGEPA